ncbi:MAG: anthrone oxygenase family protein [Bryobacteraceae bacterium]
MTRMFNVPRNDALAAVDPASTGGASLWAGYLKSWTNWNHVRTVAGAAAAAALTMAIR